MQVLLAGRLLCMETPVLASLVAMRVATKSLQDHVDLWSRTHAIGPGLERSMARMQRAIDCTDAFIVGLLVVVVVLFWRFVIVRHLER